MTKSITYQVTVNERGTFWRLNGKLHREDGPALEYADGTKAWYINGKLHREDGPAAELANGTKCWYINNSLHRLDGPAIERASGSKCWYVDGKKLAEHQFIEATQPMES